MQETLFLDTSHEPFDVRRQIGRPWRKPRAFNPFVFQDLPKRISELRVAIHDQVSLAIKKAVLDIGQVPGDLLHPGFRRIHSAAREVNSPRGHFHDEEQIVRDQSSHGPDFDRREVDGTQHVPMRLDESLPCRLPFPFRSRFEAVFFEDVAHRLVGHLVAEILQRALNPIVSPRGILTSEPQNELDDLFFHTWPAYRLAALTVVPFLSHQRSVPTQDRVRRKQRADLLEPLSSKDLALDGQSTPLIVVEQNPLLAKLLFQDLVFGPEVFDPLLLFSMNSTGQDHEQELPRLQNETHVGSFGEVRGSHIHHRLSAAAMQRSTTVTIPRSCPERAGCAFCRAFAVRALRSRPAEIHAMHDGRTPTTIGI